MKLILRLKSDTRDICARVGTVNLEWYKKTLKLVYRDRYGNILGIYKMNEIENMICEERRNGEK